MTKAGPIASQLAQIWRGPPLSEASAEQLAGMARAYEAPARAPLLREGGTTAELSILVLGRAALTERVAGRGSVTVMTIEPGDVFGWSAIIEPYRAVANVVSQEPVEVIAFDGLTLRAAMHDDHELAASINEQLLKALSTRLVATRHLLLDLYGAGATEPVFEAR